VGEEAPALELSSVSARYPSASGGSANLPVRPALADVNMSVPAGGIIAVLGANGAGKSTLLRIAAGLLTPTEGTVRWLGRDIRSLDRRGRARVVAFVAQAEATPVGFGVREVVAMGRAPHQGGWMRERPCDDAAVRRALLRCDLVGLTDRPIETLSGGEQRRVAIARALAQEARVLLLDEPASFLDVRHRIDLHALIEGLASRDGIAIVAAMHDLDEAAHLASHIVLLREGRVVAEGPPERAMTAPLLRETFGAELDVGVHSASGRRFFVPRASRSRELGE
jgi:iron complex transport system ATP-binding protein